MKRQIVNSMIAGVLGIVLLGACSIDPAPAANLGTPTGKIVSDPSRKLSSSCSQKVKAQKVADSSETILTKLVPLVPGKEIRPEMAIRP